MLPCSPFDDQSLTSRLRGVVQLGRAHACVSAKSAWCNGGPYGCDYSLLEWAQRDCAVPAGRTIGDGRRPRTWRWPGARFAPAILHDVVGRPQLQRRWRLPWRWRLRTRLGVSGGRGTWPERAFRSALPQLRRAGSSKRSLGAGRLLGRRAWPCAAAGVSRLESLQVRLLRIQ